MNTLTTLERQRKLRAVRNNPKLYNGTPIEQASLEAEIISLKGNCTPCYANAHRWVAPYKHA